MNGGGVKEKDQKKTAWVFRSKVWPEYSVKHNEQKIKEIETLKDIEEAKNIQSLLTSPRFFWIFFIILIINVL